MLNVFRSNRLERLADGLAEAVSCPLSSPFAMEEIGVSGLGMRSWLERALALRRGILAGVRFPFFREIIERILHASHSVEDEAPTFSEEQWFWSILEALPRLLAHDSFGRLRYYLRLDLNGVRRLQLARKIACAFDEYALYRPEMVLDWERGREDHWQAILWREVVARQGAHHVARRAKDLLERISAGERLVLPFERVSLFGVSLLAPLYIKVLAALPQDIPVNLFVISPSREWWADLNTAKRSLLSTAPDAAPAPGNDLLTAFGRVPRDFQWILEETVSYTEPSDDLYVDPAPGDNASLLHRIQSDMLNLRQASRAANIRPDDDSIRIHACHGPMREVEVLKDQLLDIFDDRRRGVGPDDVMVLSPNIERYVPFIEAVFGTGQRPIPFNIAAGSALPDAPVVHALMRLLDLPESRLTVQPLFDLLMLDPVRGRFDLTEEEVIDARQWIVGAGVRWGIDEAHRRELGQPGFREHTWRFGIDRMLLGLALPEESGDLFCGVSPFGTFDCQTAITLGKLVSFLEDLFKTIDQLKAPRAVPEWAEAIKAAIKRMMLVSPADEPEHQAVRAVIREIPHQATAGGYTGALSFAAFKKLLIEGINNEQGQKGWYPYGVTFSSLLTMRSLPAKVVALLGMNDADFPRRRSVPGFDLMAEKPRIGDRAVGSDDRYQFLEAVLAASEVLLISYVGQSIRDGSAIPTSLVVSELLDTLAAYGLDEASWVLVHPLQPFSLRYFRHSAEPRLFSYDSMGFAGASAMVTSVDTPVVFFPSPLPRSDDAPLFDLATLVEFYTAPARHLMLRGLGARFDLSTEAVPEWEPMDRGGKETWPACDRLLEAGLFGPSLEDLYPRMAAAGLLPPGKMGLSRFKWLARDVRPIVRETAPYLRDPGLDPLELDLWLETAKGPTRLVGRVDRIRKEARLSYGFFYADGPRLLALWLHHLALLALKATGYPKTSVLIGRKSDAACDQVEIGPISGDAACLLADLVDLYRIGAQKPIPLIPTLSYEYAKALFAGKPPDAALSTVTEMMKRDRQAAHPAFRTLFRGVDPLTDDVPDLSFDAVARRVFMPFLDAIHSRRQP